MKQGEINASKKENEKRRIRMSKCKERNFVKERKMIKELTINKKRK